MMQLTLSLKYPTQLRCIRPDIYNKLVQSVVNSIRLYGGNVKYEYHMIIALFDEESFAFWLDILLIVESLRKLFDAVKRELYGYICILSDVIDNEKAYLFLNSLPAVKAVSGIWCTRHVQKKLESFFCFNEFRTAGRRLSPPEPVAEIQNTQPSLEAQKQHRLRKIMARHFDDKSAEDNAALTGREFTGKRDFLRWYCVSHGVVPLTVRFGSWGQGLNCFSDALSPEIRAFIESKNVKIPDEADELYKMLFAERLRSEYSGYSLQKAEKFFQILLEIYSLAVSSEKKYGTLVLENIQNADDNMRRIIMNHAAYCEKNKIVIYAACNLPKLPADWKSLFPTVINCLNADSTPVFQRRTLSPSLWEVAYACAMLGRYIPPFMFLEFWHEEGKSESAVNKAAGLLFRHGIIRSKQDPECELSGFIEGVENLLGSRTVYIRGMTARLLVSWTAKRKLMPCFNLLEALHSLGGHFSPIFALEAINQDVINNTCRDIDKAIEENRFGEICGDEYSPALYYIYKTSKSLLYGDETEIRDTFSSLNVPETGISNYKAQILTKNAFYKMGIHDRSTAFEEIKESMIICQNSRNKYGIEQVYRLIAFVNLAKNKLGAAIDYLSFAIEASERGGNNVELALDYYYAAGCHFIFGNISKAQRLVKQSERAAGISGMEEWAMRAKFFSGRLYFETGCYGEAMDIFQSLYEHYGADGNSVRVQTIEAWIFRTELYLYGKTIIEREFPSGDGLLFNIEAACFSGDYERTLSLSRSLLSSLPDNGFLFIEQPDWTSGFAQCELLQISKKDFYTRIASAWQALAASMQTAKDLDEALSLLKKTIRDKQTGETDPSAPFLFFANYKILRQTGASEPDVNAAISIAFKRLQCRSSRIDEIETRRSFLTNHYWNKTLFASAKEHKLI
jgi:tetratricopeptide (TPR) repeat protein